MVVAGLDAMACLASGQPAIRAELGELGACKGMCSASWDVVFLCYAWARLLFLIVRFRFHALTFVDFCLVHCYIVFRLLFSIDGSASVASHRVDC